ncbi:dihydroxy-acid dehydratase [Devosia sp. Root413D1]|uniref:IlvD/Edd family dehydratase n=1 Tax=Devosia sp. Root413D1 TaxID=1736531 RepID=UPI00070080EE|nr:IlvD/Edd family dehydratase [Devosia sp. Root413D1]KQW77753.1 dihydroxy-acid dehydratase [Devosia sp. Root413D1]
MPDGLRRKLTTYGDQGFSLFLRKAFIKAMGYSDDALDRPIVGIANTYSDYNPCHGNVPQLIEAAKRGVMLSGALPMVFPTISIHESFASPTSMYLRNLMAMETEEMIRAQPMDSVVLIGGCDKTLPAQIMAAASSDIPAVFLPTGPMATGHHKGERLGACTDCRRFWGRYRAGEIDEAEINEVNNRLVSSVGTCTVMGTASTMANLTEVLGLCLPRGGSAPATEAERTRLAEETGRLAGRLAAEGGPTVRELLTPAALKNAMVALQAMGGSTNAVVHLAAICGRLGIKLDTDLLDEVGKRVPLLVDLQPSGQHYMQQFHQAGGVPALLKEVRAELDTSAATIHGKSIGEVIDAVVDEPGQTIIRTMAAPLKPIGTLAVLKGNLAPRGAIIKQSAASKTLMQHRGRAVVFENTEDLANRLDSDDLDVSPADILVLRNAGPKGAPGMPEAGYMPIPRKLARQGVKDMVRISDARMSGTAFGTVVLHIAPESADGGPLAIVQTGDFIVLDVPARRIHLDIPAAEFDRRMAALPAPKPAPPRGYAQLYHNHVTQADEGADFDFMQDQES